MAVVPPKLTLWPARATPKTFTLLARPFTSTSAGPAKENCPAVKSCTTSVTTTSGQPDRAAIPDNRKVTFVASPENRDYRSRHHADRGPAQADTEAHSERFSSRAPQRQRRRHFPDAGGGVKRKADCCSGGIVCAGRFPGGKERISDIITERPPVSAQ